MDIDSSIFKAYDIRGVYPEEINKDVSYRVSRAFAVFVKDFYNIAVPKIVIGYDIRKSSKELLEGALQGLIEEGAKAIDIGLCTTPLNYFANWRLKADASVMITASHNPRDYNGLKLSLKKVTALAEVNGMEKLKELAVNLLANKNEQVIENGRGKVERKNLHDDYLNFLTGQAEDSDFSQFRIAVDCGNGMVGPLFQELAERVGLNYRGLFMEPNGDFPNHEPNPLDEKALGSLRKLMRQEKFDLGIIFDGDGDRFMALAGTGELIRSDFLLGLFAQYFLLGEENQEVPSDLRLSRGVQEVLEQAGIKVVKCKVGYPHLRKEMRERDAFVGGELSGHFFWQDFSCAESGLLSMLRLLKILGKENKPINELVRPMRRYFNSGGINFKVKSKDKKIKEIEKKYQDGEISHLDGLTVEYNDWWFNIRPSNTEPLLRVVAEASSKELLEQRIKELTRLITN